MMLLGLAAAARVAPDQQRMREHFEKTRPGARRLRRRVVPVLLFLEVLLPVPVAARRAGRQLAYTSVAQVHALSRAEAQKHYPVHLRTVVTYFDPTSRNLFLNDDTGGIWIRWDPATTRPKVGDLLDVVGETSATFAPDVSNARWTQIGRAPMPVPRRVTYEQMMSTSEDSQWVELEGTIRQAEYLHRTPVERVLWMELAISGANVDIEIPWNGAPVPAGLIDSRVRIHGICGAEFNPRDQMVGVNLYVPSLAEVFTIEAGQPEVLVSPTPLGSLQRFGFHPSEGHRIKVQGVVTAVAPLQGFYLQDASGSVSVVTRADMRLKVGDEVEALGFVGIAGGHVRLENALSRRLRAGADIQPLAITAEQAMSGLYDSDYVSLEGRVVGVSTLPHQQRLELSAGPLTFPVVYAHQTTADSLPQPGSLVRIHGVCITDINDLGQVASFEIMLNDAQSAKVIGRAPWWTMQRVGALLAILAAAISFVLVWVAVLKRRVRQQTHVIRQKLAQEESLKNAAQAASRAKSEFLANMSHEIRTPMNAIVGFTDLLLGTPLNDEQRDYVSTVQFSSNALTRILNDVLDFSKIEAGHLVCEQVPFSIRSCVARAVQLIAPEALRKGLATEIEVDPNVRDELIGDPYRLNQVLLNLLNNALKFTEAGSVKVMVRVCAQNAAGCELQFSVIDTGIGIPEAAQGRIFESFSQADNSTTRKYGGTGLGLAICSRLVALFGGKIWLERNAGPGSTFHFTAQFGALPPAKPVDSEATSSVARS